MHGERIKGKITAILTAIFDDMPFLVTVHSLTDTSYKAYITSTNVDFLGKIIGKNGETANALKKLLHIVEKQMDISITLWIERNVTP